MFRRARLRAELAFVAPAIVAMVGLIAFPIAYTVFMSLHDYSLVSLGPPSFVGLANFADVLKQPTFWHAVGRTLYYTALSVGTPLLIGLLSALVFNRRFRGRGIARTIYLLPMMATPAAMALIWELMFHPTLGVLNYFLSLLHLSPSLWIFSPATVIPSLALVEIWQSIPFMTIIILGGLASVPQDLIEASRVDGARPYQQFASLVFPLVWPYIAVAILLRTIDALKAFDTIYVMTQGGPGDASETINLYLFNQAFSYYQIGYASAVVILFLVIIGAASFGLIRLRQGTAWRSA